MPCFFCQVSVEGVMGNIQANDPDASGSANFDVVNLRADGQYKVISIQSEVLQRTLHVMCRKS